MLTPEGYDPYAYNFVPKDDQGDFFCKDKGSLYSTPERYKLQNIIMHFLIIKQINLQTETKPKH